MRAFRRQDGKLRDLGTLGGTSSQADAINERDQVVGWAATGAKNEDGSQVWHPFVWQNGKMVDLGTLAGQGRAVAINDRAQIVGWSETKSGAPHAVLWTRTR